MAGNASLSTNLGYYKYSGISTTENAYLDDDNLRVGIGLLV